VAAGGIVKPPHATQLPEIALATVAICDFGTTNVADAATGRRALIDPSSNANIRES